VEMFLPSSMYLHNLVPNELSTGTIYLHLSSPMIFTLNFTSHILYYFPNFKFAVRLVTWPLNCNVRMKDEIKFYFSRVKLSLQFVDMYLMLLEPSKRTNHSPYLNNEQINWKIHTFICLYRNSK
jgi:hypothetical protein